MRRTLPILIGLLVVMTVSAFAYYSGNPTLPMQPTFVKGTQTDDAPMRANTGSVRADTTWYGDYTQIGSEYYARNSLHRQDVMWTFDRGNGPTQNLLPNAIYNGEGWLAKDQTTNDALYFRVIDSSLNLGQGVSAPIIAGTKSLWVGVDKPQADALCWTCGAGYGNNWCQRVVSEPLAYNGSGSVTLNFKYFNKSEPCYDGTQVYLRRADTTELLLNPTPTGGCTSNPDFENKGGFTDSIGSYLNPAIYNRVVTADEIGGAQTVNFIVEFKSDGGYSDEDCSYATTWGPFGCDDMTINGGGINKTYSFETGLQNWVPGFCNPVGLFVNIVDVGCYTILDPCTCKLEGNVVAMHADVCDNGVHPTGQLIEILSPICDDSANQNLKNIFMQFDMYAELPQENGVNIRPGWKYYPWTCDVTGVTGWSPRIGQDAWNYVGADPVCGTWRYGGTTIAAGTSIPADAQKVQAIIELISNCATFTITNCSGITNFTPLFDNIAVAVTAGITAPSISNDNGTRFQDHGSYPSTSFDPRAVGPADVDLHKYFGQSGKPTLGGDSLTVAGPQPGSDPNKRWEARMWWRVAKRSPFNSDKANLVDTRYKTWRDRVSDGKKIDRPYKPEFCFGWMDSVQNGSIPLRNKFMSSFRESDDDFVGEGNPENEMLWDDIFFPGTRIDYFCTANYIGTPNSLYYLPDTTGQFYYEFEILPGNRTANVPNCGGTGLNYCVYHPATLYIDAYNGGGQNYIENALRTILNGYQPCAQETFCPIPDNRNWDRYDYLDSASNFKVQFARNSINGSNNGMTLSQILGYRAILVSTGVYGSGTMDDIDFHLFDQWLTSPLCNANTNRQVFIMNGDKAGELLTHWPTYGVPFLNNTLGATLLCDGFNGLSQDPDCSPQELAYCVRWLPIQGGPFSTQEDVDVYGNYCPNKYGFNVFSGSGTGVGNRYYLADGGTQKQMQYAQVVNQNLGPDFNFRTVIDGGSWHHMTQRNASGNPSYCPTDIPSIVSGSLTEIGAAMKWGFGVTDYNNIPKLTSAQELASCQGTWTIPSDVGGDANNSLMVNRLWQNQPNPFNPRTTIKYSLAQSGPVQIMIYDVNGRLVKTLVNGMKPAGPNSEVWDGTNDQNHKVGSGIFWAQMKAGSFVSNKKMVVLK